MKTKDKLRLQLQHRISQLKREMIDMPYMETMTEQSRDLYLRDQAQKELLVRIDELEQAIQRLEAAR